MTERARLSVEGLRVVTRRSRAPVVEDVSFSVDSGKTLGLVGESGSGKTTVALALLGYTRRGLELAGGRVLVDGDDVLALRPEAVRKLRGARVAYVPQDPSTALNPALKVGTQLKELLAKYDDEAAGLGAERVHEVLGDVRLDAGDVLGSYPHQLSGGQQQRLALAMAFLLRPAVIVLDEPTTALDVTTQRHVLNTIRSLCGVHGVASVFVSHDLAVIGELVDHVAVLYAGSIVERGPTDTVLGQPTHPYTRGLLKAIPSPTRRYPLVGLPGQPPRPREGRWSACAFAPRCEYAADKCLAGGPPLEQLNGNEHAVRCVRWPELPPPGARIEEGSNGHRSAAQALAVRGIKASYGGVEVLHGVDFELDRRSCLAVVGESGSGKTTLARCLVGMHRRWDGEVMLNGEPLARSLRDRPKEALRTMQYIFQSPYASLNPRRTVREIVEQPLRYFFDLSRDERAKRVAAALEDAALDSSFEPRLPSELSGGERQRVAIARALAAEPDILVCDEITSALDVSVQAAIIETLRRLQEQRELALVFITHNLALVKSVAQHVVVMCEGAVVETGITDDVLARPEAEYTRRLISDVPKPRVSAFQPG